MPVEPVVFLHTPRKCTIARQKIKEKILGGGTSPSLDPSPTRKGVPTTPSPAVADLESDAGGARHEGIPLPTGGGG